MTDLQNRLTALGLHPVIYRGDVCLDFTKVDDIIADVPIAYTRRRYGDKTFCWVHVYRWHEWSELPCDPWPCVTPKKSEIVIEIQRLRKGI